MIPPQQIRTVYDNSTKVIAAINRLAATGVMVGVPADKGTRTDGGINNAALAYIHENGEPAHNIPARPALVPGVRSVQAQTIQQLREAAKFALKGDEDAMMQQFHAAGMVASQAVKKQITQGLSPPLKMGTILGRLRRTQRGQQTLRKMRQAGTNILAWGAENMKPLYDTGQLIRAYSYVIRSKGKVDVKAPDGGP